MKRFIESGVMGLLAMVVSVTARGQVTQEKLSMDLLQSLNASLGQLTARVSPAVVHIRVASYRSSADEQEGNEEKSQIFRKQRGAGSGVIVDPDGYIVTALHLVEGERRIRVELNNRAVRTVPAGQTQDYKAKLSYDATFVGSFKEADIAVLKIEARHLPILSFAESDNLKQGELVAAMGSPEGLRNSLSLGVVSSVAQQIEPDDPMSYIQTDAALAPGSSGGPLVDVQGGIVGINVFSLTDKGREEGLGFAVPSGMVRFIYEQIREFGCVPRPYVGLEVQGVTPTLAAALGLPTDSGIVVAGVAPGSPAQQASVHAGDLILAFAGRTLESVPQLNWAILHKRAGQHVVLEIARKSTKMSLNLTLVGAPPDSGAGVAAADIEQNSLDKLGVVGSVSKYSATEPRAKDSSPGVLVTAKLSGNEMQPELAIGDVIRSVNGVSIDSVASLRAVLDSFKSGDAVALQVERKGRLMYITFEMD
jgi:serine protease Do